MYRPRIKRQLQVMPCQHPRHQPRIIRAVLSKSNNHRFITSLHRTAKRLSQSRQAHPHRVAKVISPKRNLKRVVKIVSKTK